VAGTTRVSSLLSSIKELLGIPIDTIDFDTQLVMHINMVLGTLSQIGFSTGDPYLITATDGSIEDYLPDDESIHGMVLIYIYTKVRLLFDPPSSAFVLDSLNSVIKEYEWRLQTYTESQTV
jgi:hypothetical protein